MIYVNCFDITDLKKSEYEMLYSLASEERKRRADQYANYKNAVRCIVGEMLLQYSLLQMQVVVQDLTISYNEHQKPFLKNVDNFYFNISHSGKWVVLACGSQELGVDVEKGRTDRKVEMIAKRFFAEKEQTYIEENPNEKVKRFTEIWTSKEAYVKYLGTGLSEGLDTFSVVGKTKKIYDESGEPIPGIELQTCWLDDEYALSVCSKERKYVVNKLTLEEMMYRRVL